LRSPLREASIHVVEGHSLVVPLIIEGLPDQIEVLGCVWARKVEFHLTAISVSKLMGAAPERPDLWPLVTRVAANRSLGPIAVLDELRRVSGHPDKPGLRTLVVMARAGGLDAFYDDLSSALGVELVPPPAHVTIYSSDPTDGIGIDDEHELAERAPALSADEQAEVMAAMRFAEVFGG
jgi:hypothetical protein